VVSQFREGDAPAFPVNRQRDYTIERTVMLEEYWVTGAKTSICKHADSQMWINLFHCRLFIYLFVYLPFI
jgi:hypothetical protein